MANIERPGYIVTHNWVAYHLGRPRECSACGFKSDNSRQFHWANVSKTYERDLNDFIRLCVPCHYAFDNELKDECKHGHAYTKENTYYKNGKSRECMICRRNQYKKFIERNNK